MFAWSGPNNMWTRIVLFINIQIYNSSTAKESILKLNYLHNQTAPIIYSSYILNINYFLITTE